MATFNLSSTVAEIYEQIDCFEPSSHVFMLFSNHWLTRFIQVSIAGVGLACSMMYIDKQNVHKAAISAMTTEASQQPDKVRSVPILSGETLEQLLTRLEIKPADEILKQAKLYTNTSQLTAEQVVEITQGVDSIERVLIPINKHEILRIELTGETEVYLDELALDSHHAVVQIKAKQIFENTLPIDPKLKTSVSHIVNQATDIFNQLQPEDQILFGVKGDFFANELHNINKIYAMQIQSEKNEHLLIHYGSPGRWYKSDGTSSLRPFLRAPMTRRAVTGWFMEKRGKRYHKGLDLAGPVGTPIHAAADGVVYEAERKNGYGLVVVLNHPQFGDYLTLYAHMSRFKVNDGDFVQQGDIIGYVGMTGRTTGPHLHYEIQERGARIDPQDFSIGPDHILTTEAFKELTRLQQKWQQIFSEQPAVEQGIQVSLRKKDKSQCTILTLSNPCIVIPKTTHHVLQDVTASAN